MKMRVREFAACTGVSVRTLHHYDAIGLLPPAHVDGQTGYRYYDEDSLIRMQAILFYRELDFSLKTIGEILSSPAFDARQAMAQQRKLLTLQKERLERLIAAIDDAMEGESNIMEAFDNSKLEAYKAEAREKWGHTAAYAEYTEKAKGRGKADNSRLTGEMDALMASFAACMREGHAPDAPAARERVRALQQHITANYYRCTDAILMGLGEMYVADDRFRANIDRHGEGTAAYIRDAIGACCR